MYTLKKEFVMAQSDIEAYKALPDNLPETVLSKKQKQLIYSLYYKYLGRVFYGWGSELWKLEKGEKWPSGPRVKDHEAMRMILGHLISENIYKPKMTDKRAADHFFGALTCRQSYAELLRQIYERK